MTSLRPAGSTRAWRRLRAFVLWRDNYSCRVPVDRAGRIDPAGQPCGLPATTVDHIVPRTQGGNDDPANLRAACEPHNTDKGGRRDEEVAERPPAPSSRPRPRGRPDRPARLWTWE